MNKNFAKKTMPAPTVKEFINQIEVNRAKTDYSNNLFAKSVSRVVSEYINEYADKLGYNEWEIESIYNNKTYCFTNKSFLGATKAQKLGIAYEFLENIIEKSSFYFPYWDVLRNELPPYDSYRAEQDLTAFMNKMQRILGIDDNTHRYFLDHNQWNEMVEDEPFEGVEYYSKVVRYFKSLYVMTSDIDDTDKCVLDDYIERGLI